MIFPIPLIRLTNASFGYRRRVVVARVSCAAHAGQCLGIYGPNGVGKSTLLRGISGLLRPLDGAVEIAAGTRFGYLQQQRTGESHWPMTAFDAAAMATSARARLGFLHCGRDTILQKLEQLGVVELARRPFFQLSGGQQQRVLLAGALAADPTVLILDEPMSGIDAGARQQLIDHLLQAKRGGLAVLLVSHEIADLVALADQALLLEPAAEAGRSATALAVAPRDILDRLVAGRSSLAAQEVAR